MRRPGRSPWTAVHSSRSDLPGQEPGPSNPGSCWPDSDRAAWASWGCATLRGKPAIANTSLLQQPKRPRIESALMLASQGAAGELAERARTGCFTVADATQAVMEIQA